MKKLFLSICMLISVGVHAQYDIKVDIGGLDCKDKLRLAFHSGSTQLLQDSSVCENGVFHFRGSKTLPTGNYLVILPNNNFFDILVSDNEDQTKYFFKTDTNLYADGITTSGSDENTIFLEFRKYKALKDYYAYGVKQQFESETDATKKAELKKKIEAMSEEISEKKKSIIDSYPNSFVSKLFNLDIEVPMVKVPTGLEGESARMYKYVWIRNHFFDNVDFTEVGLLRTSSLVPKIHSYFDKYGPRDIDTAIAMADKLLSKIESEAGLETYKTAVHAVTTYFERSKRMCYDKGLWHMASNYFCKGKATWASADHIAKTCAFSKQKNATLCGRKVPDINMPDTSFDTRSRLYDVDKAVTVLIFWDIDCLHCTMEMPQISATYDTLDKTNFEVYAVYTKKDYAGWKKRVAKEKFNFINVANVHEDDSYNDEYNIVALPAIFVLDKDKNIVFKDISASDIPRIVDYLVKEQE